MTTATPVASIEALVARLAPDLERLETDSMAALLSVEIARCVESVQDEGLQRLAELATAGEN